MALFRKLHTAFWQDAKVIEELTPEDKFFFIYLLTNPSTTQIGIYQITKKQMSFELGYSMESINSLMDRFENHHRLIRYNPATREVAIKNWGKYNLDRSGKPMIDCVERELAEVSDKSLVEYVSDGIKKESIKKIFKDYLKENITYKEDNDMDNNSCSDTLNKFDNDTYTDSCIDTLNKFVSDTYNESYNDTSKNLEQEKEKEKEKEKEEDKKIYNVGMYVKLYEQNIGPINKVAYDWILSISEKIDINLFKRAIEIATDKSKVNKGYIGGIINKWIANNIKTYNDLKAYENKGGYTNDRRFKYATEYEREDEKYYQKPTEQQLKRAKELLESI